MRFAYADPPYLGCALRLYGDHPDAAVYDTIDGHQALLDRLSDEFPDGWAYSLSSTTLRQILPLAPDDARVGAWVKPFASFKPNVGVAYAWEPVIFRGGRKRTRDQDTVRDWVSANITLERGVPGAKPLDVIDWILAVLNVTPGDDVVDLFPGSGAVEAVIERRVKRKQT